MSADFLAAVKQRHEEMFPAHPAVRQPSLEEALQVLEVKGEDGLKELAALRAADIKNLTEFPFEFPFTVRPIWEDADELVFGGRRPTWLVPRQHSTSDIQHPTSKGAGEEMTRILVDAGLSVEELAEGLGAHARTAVQRGWVEELGCRLLVLFGGNRASKTHYAIDRLVREGASRGGLKILILHETEQRSKLHHQELAYRLLPGEWKPTEEKKIKRTLKTKITYTRADGFGNNIVAFPNGTVIQFGFYTQDVKGYEGGEYDYIFADENLPLIWLKTLLFRLYSRGGKMLWSFTAVDGITPAMAHVVEGAETLASRRAPLLPADHRATETQDWPAGHMPYVQRSTLKGVRIIYFHTALNPFSGYAAMAAEMGENLSALEIERRFYGYARNLMQRAFPLFGAKHIIKRSQVPTENVTWWMVADPAGKRNFFMLWGCVDEHGRIYVTDEWPSVPEMGEWAVLSENANRFDGDPGPAQISMGWGIQEYKRQILKVEQHAGKWLRQGVEAGPAYREAKRAVMAEMRWEDGFQPYLDYLERVGGSISVAKFKEDYEPTGSDLLERMRKARVVQVTNGLVHLPTTMPRRKGQPDVTRMGDLITFRWIDPRAGAQSNAAMEAGGSSLIERFAAEDRDAEGNITGPSMVFMQACGKHEEAGLIEINHRLSYDRGRAIVALLNEPQLYFVESCQNTIWAMGNYTGRDGEKAACKDPVDCVRYVVTSDPVFVGAAGESEVEGGGW